MVRVRCSAHRPPRSKRGTLLARASPCHSVFRRSVKRFAAENASTFRLARTRGVEPLPSGSVIRRIDPVLLRAHWRGQRGMIPHHDVERVVSWPVRRWPRFALVRIGSGRRIRTCRLVINNRPRPPRAPDRKNWWSDGVTLPARRSCKDQLHTCARPIGARTWFRATLSCSSNRRCHQISFPGGIWCGRR